MKKLTLNVIVNPFTRQTIIEARHNGEMEIVEVFSNNLQNENIPITLFAEEYLIEFEYDETFNVYIRPDTEEGLSTTGLKLKLSLKLKE